MVGGMPACAPMVPAYERGILYVAMTDGVVRAVDASTAVANWSTPLAGTIDPARGEPQPVIANGVVYVGLTDPSPHVVALDAATGEVLRFFSVRGTGLSSMIVQDHGLYAIRFDRVVAWRLP
jgi:outer membrane protein assembly factor BamB